ncbi:MAG: sulfatase, partial [Pseudomonadota bacterium]
TPNIDTLAAEGVRYTRVFTTAGVCAPSRAALMTGQHQISFGGQHMRSSTGPLGKYYAQPGPRVKAFPEIMRRHGYFTFTDGKLDYQFSGIRAGSGPFTIWDREGVDYTAWRERAEGQPFFGMVNFLQTHESGVMRVDVEAHSPAHAATQKMRVGRGLVAPTVTDPEKVKLPPYYPDLPEVRTDLARHYDNIRRMDEQVGEILAALRKDSLWDNTIVIWTTDHGDGLPRAKRELYDSGINVPLILHIPPKLRQARKEWQALQKAQNGKLISFIDLAPTLLEFAGIKLPSFLHGTSFITSQREHILASRDRIDAVMDRQRALRDDNFKYIRSWHPNTPGGHKLAYRDNLDMARAWRAAYEAGELSNPDHRRWFEPAGKEQLYDVRKDPHELKNLANDLAYQEVLVSMRDTLLFQLEYFRDMSEMEESQQMTFFLKNGRVPMTPAPKWRIDKEQIWLKSDVGASIGYRSPGETHWRLYTESLSISVKPIEVKAVRYGWLESAVIAVE